jgi:hypothetical protein
LSSADIMLLTPRQLEALQKDYRTALKLAF